MRALRLQVLLSAIGMLILSLALPWRLGTAAYAVTLNGAAVLVGSWSYLANARRLRRGAHRAAPDSAPPRSSNRLLFVVGLAAGLSAFAAPAVSEDLRPALAAPMVLFLTVVGGAMLSGAVHFPSTFHREAPDR